MRRDLRKNPRGDHAGVSDVGSGLQVNRTHLVEILKNAGLLVRVLIANFLIVPAAGYGLAKLFRLPVEVETGFLLMVIAPGVPFVLASVRKRGGRLALAVEMALVLPLLSILTIPITAALVLPAGASAHIPLGQFLVTLVLFQFVPLLLGMVVGERLPAAAQRLGKPLQIVFFAAVIALIAVMAPKLVHDVTLVYGSNGMWAMLCVVVVSLGVGGFSEARRERIGACCRSARHFVTSASVRSWQRRTSAASRLPPP